MSTNPWVRNPDRCAPHSDEELVAPAGVAPPALAPVRELQPQAESVPAPGVGLPRRSVDVPPATVAVWWVGTHGGAGESTLEQLLEGSRAMSHAWPQADDSSERPQVILVARTSARGLRSAQLAATEWASGTVLVQLLGLVLIADAPGRLPRPLRDFAQVVAGGVPRVWRLPWVEQWRLGDPVCTDTAPRAVTEFLDELRSANFTTPIR